MHSVDSGRACTTIAPHPMPRHHEESGIGDEVVEVKEPTVRAVDCPLVQLCRHPQYLGLGLGEVGHRSSVFTGELPPLRWRHCLLAGSLRRVRGFPMLGLIAVGTALAGGPPHRSQRAELTHWAPASGSGVEAHQRVGMHDVGRR